MVVGEDVTLAVQSFSTVFYSMPGMPLSACPTSVKDYRPIACCNVVYKCITKNLSSRLQAVLPLIISYTQSVL